MMKSIAIFISDTELHDLVNQLDGYTIDYLALEDDLSLQLAE